MEGEFQDQGQIDQYLEEWLSPRGSQSVHSFLYGKDKQDYIWIEYLATEGAIIINQAPEGGISTMVVVKFSNKAEGSGYNIESPLCSGFYKEEDDYLVPWLGTDTYSKMSYFTWSKEDNYWIVQ